MESFINILELLFEKGDNNKKKNVWHLVVLQEINYVWKTKDNITWKRNIVQYQPS